MFHRILERLSRAADYGQPGRGDEVLIPRRDLKELIRQFDRLDEEARARHREDNPELYPPFGTPDGL